LTAHAAISVVHRESPAVSLDRHAYLLKSKNYTLFFDHYVSQKRPTITISFDYCPLVDNLLVSIFMGQRALKLVSLLSGLS
jgi:hypothetical protein